MGLTARVYTNKNKLLSEIQSSETHVDDETGEIFFDDPTRAPPESELVALEKRLGNVALIHSLAEEIRSVVPTKSESFLLDRVLYNGSHSGDFIQVTELDALRREIISVVDLTEGHGTKELGRFLEDLSELTRMSEEQRNPIVFV